MELMWSIHILCKKFKKMSEVATIWKKKICISVLCPKTFSGQTRTAQECSLTVYLTPLYERRVNCWGGGKGLHSTVKQSLYVIILLCNCCEKKMRKDAHQACMWGRKYTFSSMQCNLDTVLARKWSIVCNLKICFLLTVSQYHLIQDKMYGTSIICI